MKRFLIRLFKENKLQLVDPSIEISDSYSEKSESNLISSKILFENERLEESVSLIYYSMYNLVLSLLFRIGIKSENHSASIILLKEIFNFDNSLINEAKVERIDKQYYTDFRITKKEVEQGILNAEGFNGNLKAFVSELKKSDTDIYGNKLKEIICKNKSSVLSEDHTEH